MSVKQTKDGRWYCTYRHEDDVKREYFGRGPGAKDKAEARDLEVRLLKKRKQFTPRPQAIHLDRLAQLFLDDAKARNTSERWRTEFASLLNTVILPTLPFKPVDRLEYKDILKLYDAWEGRTPATINRYLGYLRAVFRFGIKHSLTSKNPLATWTKAREPKRDMHLTVEDLKRLLEHAAPHLAWALEVEWELGTRPGVTELFSLRWDDVDIEAGMIHVRGSKTEGADRLIPITVRFRGRLIEMRDQAKSPFIIEYEGRPVKQMHKSLKTAAKNAGLTYNVRLYDIRHLFATIMLAGGADLAAVAALLGHANITTTQKSYYHLLQGEKERAVSLRPAIVEKKASKVIKLR